MTGSINVLNVEDGDAILIHLKKEDKDLVIVVDAAHKNDYEDIVEEALEKLLKQTNKIAPDIVVGTHYDNDHISGLVPLLKRYGDDVKEVWIHLPPEIENEIFDEEKEKKSFERISSEKQFEVLSETVNIDKELINFENALIYESIGRLRDLLKTVSRDKVRQVFAGDSYQGWPELKVLGPTQNFYNSIFPDGIDIKAEVIAELYYKLSSVHSTKESAEFYRFIDPCDTLKGGTYSGLTDTNRASIIFAIDNGQNRYLFTGDAGVESFKEVPQYKNELKDIFWLKIPHHGSQNNMSKNMIDLMNPVYAYNTGDAHEDINVLKCIQKNDRTIEVKSTKESGSNLKFEIE